MRLRKVRIEPDGLHETPEPPRHPGRCGTVPCLFPAARVRESGPRLNCWTLAAVPGTIIRALLIAALTTKDKYHQADGAD